MCSVTDEVLELSPTESWTVAIRLTDPRAGPLAGLLEASLPSSLSLLRVLAG